VWTSRKSGGVHTSQSRQTQDTLSAGRAEEAAHTEERRAGDPGAGRDAGAGRQAGGEAAGDVVAAGAETLTDA